MSEKYNFNEENKKDADEHGVGGMVYSTSCKKVMRMYVEY